MGADIPGMRHGFESVYLSRMGSLYLRARWFWGGGLLLLPGLLSLGGFGVTEGWALSAAGAIILAHAFGAKVLGLEAVTSTIFVDLAVVHGAVILMSSRGADHSLALLVMVGATVVISLFTEGLALAFAISLNAALGLAGLVATGNLTSGLLIAPFIGSLFLVALVALLLGSFRARLVQLEMARALTLGIVSHELRNRLTGIVGITELISEGDVSLDAEERAELMLMAHGEAVEAAGVIEDLLAASRTERGILESSPQPTDISPLVARAVAQSLPEGGTPVVRGTDQPVWAMADGTRLGQVMRNLLANARLHGGPNVDVAVGSLGGAVSVLVIDDGPGVHPSDLPGLFLPYRSGRHDPAPGSTGLGLWISRSLMQSMGGDLLYRRQDDKTVFEATLVACEPVEASNAPLEADRIGYGRQSSPQGEVEGNGPAPQTDRRTTPNGTRARR